jgi:50S ribosomal protein L16 3-hydroxylase
MKSKLQNFDPARFMRGHWQSKPLFVKNALPANFLNLQPADLFKLAQRPEVESRLISRKNRRGHWRYSAMDGAFEKDQFAAYKTQRDWTLLVQRVNEWLPRVDLLFEYFNFIANWRIDDIMISYAAPGGTVGPHLDNYDVFLCQLQGERTWQYSKRTSKGENLEAGQPVRLLTDFKADFEVVAHPGDVLYIPPQFAHYGIADTESITVSVGFRAPQIGQLMSILFDKLASQMGEKFYSDKGATIPKHPGQFGELPLKKLSALAKSGLASGSRRLKAEDLNDAILRELSMTPNAQIRTQTKIALAEFKSRWLKAPLQRNPRNQYFYRAAQGSATLYAAGESFVLPTTLQPMVAEFCNGRMFPCTTTRLKPRALEFWYEIFSLGFLFFPK